MKATFQPIADFFTLTYGQKLFLLATVPLILAVTLISIVVTNQSRALAEREIAALETQLISTKREELKNYLSIARTSFVNTYGRAAPDDEAAKLQVTQLLSAILYGQDGYFFVFDYDGNNLVAPRQTYLINRNWSGLEDATGVAITDELIRIARTGGGYHSFDWPKPSTGETGRMIVYVNGLQDWRWVVGTQCARRRRRPDRTNLALHRGHRNCGDHRGVLVGSRAQYPRTQAGGCKAQRPHPTDHRHPRRRTRAGGTRIARRDQPNAGGGALRTRTHKTAPTNGGRPDRRKP